MPERRSLQDFLKIERPPLTHDQIAAIIFTIALGKELQTNFPQLGSEYLGGKSTTKLVEELKLDEKYPLFNTPTLINAVRLAIKGYDGSYAPSSTEPYDGLIDPSLYRDLAHSQGGKATRDKEVGMFAILAEERRRITQECHRKLGRTPWTDEEVEIIYELLDDPDYIRTTPPRYGHPDREKISAEINRLIHDGKNVRKPHTIGYYIRKFRRGDI